MKRAILLIFICVLSVMTQAQIISVKSFSLRPNDLKARTAPRKAPDGSLCALVKVGIVGVKDLQFIEAVGDVSNQMGEYYVYLPPKTRSLTYETPDRKIQGKVDFATYGIGIEEQKVYQLLFETGRNVRYACFLVSPQTASLKVDGKPVAMDETGNALIELTKGKHSYSLSADGYFPESNDFELTDEELTRVLTLDLEQKTYPFNVSCTPSNASLFIDYVPYGEVGQATGIRLAEGKHRLRLVASGYSEVNRDFIVNNKTDESIVMNRNRTKTKRFTNERTRTSVNIRPAIYWDFGGDYYADKKKYDERYTANIKIGTNWMPHFWGIFSFNTGLLMGVAIPDIPAEGEDKDYTFETEGDGKPSVGLILEMPMQVGISIPHGKFNSNLFSILGGMYGTYILATKEALWKDETSYEGSKSLNEYDYGLRTTVRYDWNMFSVALNANLSLNNHGVSFGLTIAKKFYY